MPDHGGRWILQFVTIHTGANYKTEEGIGRILPTFANTSSAMVLSISNVIFGHR